MMDVTAWLRERAERIEGVGAELAAVEARALRSAAHELEAAFSAPAEAAP